MNRQHPITDSDKEFISSMCTFLGIALHNAWLHRKLEENRNAERELRAVADRIAEAEKMSAVNEMVAGVIHEMKNPLSVAVGNCFLASQEAGVPESAKARIERVKLAIDRSLKIADNFLSFARGTGGRELPTDINTVIRQTADLLDHEFRMNNVGLVLELEKVPVMTTKEPGVGTGLGLAVSRRIIQNYNGRLIFASVPNQGTTFSVELPVNSTSAQPHREAEVYPLGRSAAAK